MMRKLVLIGFLLSVTLALQGQDVQFSQFYANATYINPAFAGGLHYERIGVAYRGQWINLDAKYNTYLASGDIFYDRSNSGLGLYVLRDVQGKNTLSSTEIAAQYAYELDISRRFTFRAGGQLSFVTRYLDYSRLFFPSQYTDDGLQSNNSINQSLGNDRVNYPDVSFGGIFYDKNFWVGFSGHHLNRPQQSFIKGDVNNLPVRWAVIGGYKISFYKFKDGLVHREKEKSITPTFHYKVQGKSDQFDLGAYLHYHQLMAGLWYRGIPVKRLQNIQNNESMIAMLGFRYHYWIFRYSYDFTVSTLGPAGTGGAHEISFSVIDFVQKRKRKPPKRIPCPTFM